MLPLRPQFGSFVGLCLLLTFAIAGGDGARSEPSEDSVTEANKPASLDKENNAATDEEPPPEPWDYLRQVQADAVRLQRSPVAHWGVEPERYISWSTHSNRLVPVYTFGTRVNRRELNLNNWAGERSAYRSTGALRNLYGAIPRETLNPEATYLDQTNLGELQKAALKAGKRHIFLVVFDGMDWQTTRAAAIYNSGRVAYERGRGTGLHFLNGDAKGTGQFGYFVAAPRMDKLKVDPNTQTIRFGSVAEPGGYDAEQGGPNPWTAGSRESYLIGRKNGPQIGHPYPDSAATATAMTTGTRTYNGAIGVDWIGTPLESVAHLAQSRYFFGTGIVTSVPISHATPGSAYAHNVTRQDYQDIAKDLLGRPSVSHPDRPLPGLDVVLGAGWGVEAKGDSGQGRNFEPGLKYVAESDIEAIDVENGGNYVVVQRTEGVDGGEAIIEAAKLARKQRKKLFGLFGTKEAHLPFRTADGGYNPTRGLNKAESYTPEDITENPTLAELTSAAIDVLSAKPLGFWLMVEAGDVDWANHDNNLDNSIGAVLSGDEAVQVIIDWVEQNSSWEESLMIVTADHGHMLVIERPELLVDPGPPTPTDKKETPSEPKPSTFGTER